MQFPQIWGEDCDRRWYRESKPCNGKGPCPVDGYLTPWSAWGTCDRPCDGGTNVRTRFCNKPRHGGADCVGEAKETEACNTEECEWTAKEIAQAIGVGIGAGAAGVAGTVGVIAVAG